MVEKIEDLAREYEKTFKNIEEGEVVKGEVIRIERGEVVIDIGYKSEGIVPLEEFLGERKELQVKVGDKVEVLLVEKENAEGIVALSKRKADYLQGWKKIINAQENNKVLEGKVINEVRGGLKVDIGGNWGFLPASQVSPRPVGGLRQYIGQVLRLKVVKLNKKRRNIVLSQRVVEEEKQSLKREKLLSELVDGELREGVVKNLTNFGAFIDLGGIDGLLHLNDISWGRVNDPAEVLKVGERVKVVVLAFDKERERVSLGLKQTTPNPWDSVEEKYPLDSRVKGVITGLVPFGAFLKLEDGVEGLIHLKDMSWTRRIAHPGEVLAVGEEVEVVVLNTDRRNEKISLGLKQANPDPWEEISEKYKVGTHVEGKVTKIASFGVFVNLEEDIDGLIHISQLAPEHISEASEVVSVGEKIMAKVVKVSSSEHKINLSIKEYLEDQARVKVEEYIEKQEKGKAKIAEAVEKTEKDKKEKEK
jgi:small subunit ribosomal protein S1